MTLETPMERERKPHTEAAMQCHRPGGRPRCRSCQGQILSGQILSGGQEKAVGGLDVMLHQKIGQGGRIQVDGAAKYGEAPERVAWPGLISLSARPGHTGP